MQLTVLFSRNMTFKEDVTEFSENCPVRVRIACVEVDGQSASPSRPRGFVAAKGHHYWPRIQRIRLVPAAFRRLRMFKAYLIEVKYGLVLLKGSVRPGPPDGS